MRESRNSAFISYPTHPLVRKCNGLLCSYLVSLRLGRVLGNHSAIGKSVFENFLVLWLLHYHPLSISTYNLFLCHVGIFILTCFLL